MKIITLALLATVFCASSAGAQTAPESVVPAPVQKPAPPPPTLAPSTPPASPPATTRDGKPLAKDVRDACRATAIAQGLKGEPRQAAVTECFIKQRPDLADRETARVQCVKDAKTKGLAPGDERKGFMKDCMKGKV